MAATQDMAKELHEVMPLLEACRYRIPFDSMNLQDGIDFAVLCIRTTIDVQRLTLGTVAMAPEFSWPGVGGPIEIATVTAAAGHRWVQRTVVQGERPAGVAEGQGDPRLRPKPMPDRCARSGAACCRGCRPPAARRG